MSRGGKGQKKSYPQGNFLQIDCRNDIVTLPRSGVIEAGEKGLTSVKLFSIMSAEISSPASYEKTDLRDRFFLFLKTL